MSQRTEPAHPWAVRHCSGTAQELHDLEPPGDQRTVLAHEVTRPALVLGSTQSVDSVDRAMLGQRGMDLARRRSGGGAVALVPGEHVWVDVVIPRGDPMWSDDVLESSWWLGDAWAAALATVLDPGGIEVHRGAVTNRSLGRVACFAGVGPGEVSVDGAKAVGISQRRTRGWARLQCVVHRRWRPVDTWTWIAPDLRSGQLRRVLVDEVAGLDDLQAPPGWGVVEELVRHLP